MNDVYSNIDECSSAKKCKMLIMFVDMVEGIVKNKKIKPIVIDLFICSRKLNIQFIFIMQS